MGEGGWGEGVRSLTISIESVRVCGLFLPVFLNAGFQNFHNVEGLLFVVHNNKLAHEVCSFFQLETLPSLST